jgi:hypothetical protein
LARISSSASSSVDILASDTPVHSTPTLRPCALHLKLVSRTRPPHALVP